MTSFITMPSPSRASIRGPRSVPMALVQQLDALTHGVIAVFESESPKWAPVGFWDSMTGQEQPLPESILGEGLIRSE